MSARETILQRIRERIDTSEQREAAVEKRLRQRPAGPIPERARGNSEMRVERFREQARLASAEITPIDPDQGLAGLVDGLLPRRPESRSVVIDRDLEPDAAAWRRLDIDARCGRADPGDAVGVSRAVCGVAETGTVVLRSGSGKPTTAAFLPPVHVVVLAAADIVGGYEDAWARLREQGALPRTVNWITGPSRSADIEQTLNLGAHGPVRFLIALD